MYDVNDIKQKLVKVKDFKMITNFIKTLIEENYTPFLFINIKDIIIKNSETHTILQPEIEKIVKLMKDNGYIANITFLSDKVEYYKSVVYEQLATLLQCEGWNLALMSGYENLSNCIINRISTSVEIKSSYKAWFVYIDLNNKRTVTAIQIFGQIGIDQMIGMTLEDRSWKDYFSSYIFKEKYDIFDVEILEKRTE